MQYLAFFSWYSKKAPLIRRAKGQRWRRSTSDNQFYPNERERADAFSSQSWTSMVKQCATPPIFTRKKSKAKTLIPIYKLTGLGLTFTMGLENPESASTQPQFQPRSDSQLLTQLTNFTQIPTRQFQVWIDISKTINKQIKLRLSLFMFFNLPT